MDNYIKHLHEYTSYYIYDFKNNGSGGIGDFFKFFMKLLKLAIEREKRIYILKNDTYLETYIKLKYNWYISKQDIENLQEYEIYKPQELYSIRTPKTNAEIKLSDIFYFTEIVKYNSQKISPFNITNYISIHARLGDHFLETDREFVPCTWDKRNLNEFKLYKFLKTNKDKNILFFCDNQNYKNKIKRSFPFINITNANIGHTSLKNTNEKQTLDAISEFYLLVKSNKIYDASYSGFSKMAALFGNIKWSRI